MDETIALIQQAFADFRQDVDNFERKKRPTDGLLGFGKTLQNDPCQERFDERLAGLTDAMRAAGPSPEAAEQAARLLLFRDDEASWPLAAQWMLRAAERHSLPLIPYLSRETAARIRREYAARNRPWDRLPVQKQVLRALDERAKS